jgi:hypothetical protein
MQGIESNGEGDSDKSSQSKGDNKQSQKSSDNEIVEVQGDIKDSEGDEEDHKEQEESEKEQDDQEDQEDQEMEVEQEEVQPEEVQQEEVEQEAEGSDSETEKVEEVHAKSVEEVHVKSVEEVKSDSEISQQSDAELQIEDEVMGKSPHHNNSIVEGNIMRVSTPIKASSPKVTPVKRRTPRHSAAKVTPVANKSSSKKSSVRKTPGKTSLAKADILKTPTPSKSGAKTRTPKNRSVLKTTPKKSAEKKEATPVRVASAQKEESGTKRSTRSGKKSVAIEESKNQEYNDEIKKDMSRDFEEVNSSQFATSNANATLGSNMPTVIKPANIKQGEFVTPTSLGRFETKNKSNIDESVDEIDGSDNKTPIEESAKESTPIKKKASPRKSNRKGRKSASKSTPKGKKSAKKDKSPIKEDSKENHSDNDAVMEPDVDSQEGDIDRTIEDIITPLKKPTEAPKLRQLRHKKVAATVTKSKTVKSKTPTGTRRSQSKRKVNQVVKANIGKASRGTKRTNNDLNKAVDDLGLSKKHKPEESMPKSKKETKKSEPKLKKRDAKEKSKGKSQKKEIKSKKPASRGRSATKKVPQVIRLLYFAIFRMK